LNHLSLFSGIGGIDLAAEWAGMRTVAFVEQNKFCQKVLKKHWPDVPIFDDVRTVTAKDFNEPIDIISGGFPCQPFSNAGKQLGKEDDRHLWPEYSRLIKELRPTWVLGENVAGIINLALDDVLADLETLGYSTRAFVIPACAVGAHHRRERVFIVAHSDMLGRIHGEFEKHTAEGRIHAFCNSSTSCEDVAYTERLRQSGQGVHAGRIDTAANQDWKTDWTQYGSKRNEAIWDSEPNVDRVANGVPDGMDRLKSLGNAVVPEQIYPVLQAISQTELMLATKRNQIYPEKAVSLSKEPNTP
jgi:DNA (cytosine-5)-methyltransferase 1